MITNGHYTFMPLTVTWVEFQGHNGVWRDEIESCFSSNCFLFTWPQSRCRCYLKCKHEHNASEHCCPYHTSFGDLDLFLWSQEREKRKLSCFECESTKVSVCFNFYLCVLYGFCLSVCPPPPPTHPHHPPHTHTFQCMCTHTHRGFTCPFY